MQKRIASLALFILVVASLCLAQARPSPAASATCDLGGGKSIKTDYSSPRMKERKIYGDLVPYGQVWRTGANEATTFVASEDVTVGGEHVPAGSYTIFTVPNADSWKLIINKKTGEWGIPYKYESDELGRVNVKVSKLPSPVEDFTISYEKTKNGCMMHIDWDTTRASVDIVGGTVGDKMRP
ncbi:MAG: DUF2911 domain-containing protein [Candidatus Sulfotelmatobacter sp.]